MASFTSRISKALLCVLVACSCALFVPATALADLQAGSPVASFDGQASNDSGYPVENSFRYKDGQPIIETDPADQGDPIGLQSDEISLQSGNYVSNESFRQHFGIDVSEHQYGIDWAQVARADVRFAIIRCGFGSDVVRHDRATGNQDDIYWARNAKGCKAAGIPFGVYIYSYAKSVEDARDEADHVIAAIARAGISLADIQLPIYYDMEDSCQYDKSPVELRDLFNVFRSRLKDHGVSKVGLYSNASWWQNRLTMVSVEPDYRWYARYDLGDNNNSPKGPFNYGYTKLQSKDFAVWQYSSTASVPGISGKVDANFALNDWHFLQQTGSTRKMYRLFQSSTGEHLFTCDSRECGMLEGLGWIYEGIAWTAPQGGGKPVYRVYNPHCRGGDHHYTNDLNEYRSLCNGGWVGEGLAWYTPVGGNVPLYRLYNPFAETAIHHYTNSPQERDNLTENHGWIYEGIGWYGV